MATAVYDTLEVELENGKVLNLKPLSIKNLRKFMQIISVESDLENATNDLEAIDSLLKGAIFCVKALDPDEYGKMDDEEVESLLTLPTAMKVLEIAGGLKTADPNLMGANLAGMN